MFKVSEKSISASRQVNEAGPHEVKENKKVLLFFLYAGLNWMKSDQLKMSSNHLVHNF